MWLLQVSKRHCGKLILDITELFVQCNTDYCCEHITVRVNIYLHECVSLFAPEKNVCLGVCVCVCVYVCVWYGCVCDEKSEYQQETTFARPQQT